jgi:hypothetical protein
MQHLTILLSDNLQKYWLYRHIVMANSPPVAIGDSIANRGNIKYKVNVNLF